MINKLSTDTRLRREHLGKIRNREWTELPGGVCFAWGNFLPMGIKRLYGHHGNCCHEGLPSAGSADVTVCHGQQCVQIEIAAAFLCFNSSGPLVWGQGGHSKTQLRLKQSFTFRFWLTCHRLENQKCPYITATIFFSFYSYFFYFMNNRSSLALWERYLLVQGIVKNLTIRFWLFRSQFDSILIWFSTDINALISIQ